MCREGSGEIVPLTLESRLHFLETHIFATIKRMKKAARKYCEPGTLIPQELGR